MYAGVLRGSGLMSATDFKMHQKRRWILDREQ